MLAKDIEKAGFPASLYRYNEGTSFGHNLLLFVGKKEGELYFFPTKYNFFAIGNWSNKSEIDSRPRVIKPFCIKIEDIEYYIKTGDRQIYTTVSGGGDSTGALIGGLIGGATGAIIGGTEPISTTVHTDDTREVVLYFRKDGESKTLHFSHDSFDTYTINAIKDATKDKEAQPQLTVIPITKKPTRDSKAAHPHQSHTASSIYIPPTIPIIIQAK